MIRPHMVEMATQTTLAPDDPRLGRDAATLWAQQNAFDLEPAQTVRAEIYAQLMNHIRLVPSSAQEPVVVMNGISQSGVRRFFQGWPKKVEHTATVWTCHSPKHLHSLLKLETVSSRRALGPCRLHVRGAEAHGHRLLMAMPPFTAWFNVSRKGRTELRMSFKIMVFQDTTDLTPPPACDYSNRTLQQTEHYAMGVLQEMSKRGYNLSPAFFIMLGQPDRAQKAEAREAERNARLTVRRKRAAMGSEDWSASESENDQ